MLQDDIHGIVAEDTLCWDIASGRYIERWEKIEYLLRYPNAMYVNPIQHDIKIFEAVI
jgi:hypothetical protein